MKDEDFSQHIKLLQALVPQVAAAAVSKISEVCGLKKTIVAITLLDLMVFSLHRLAPMELTEYLTKMLEELPKKEDPTKELIEKREELFDIIELTTTT